MSFESVAVFFYDSPTSLESVKVFLCAAPTSLCPANVAISGSLRLMSALAMLQSKDVVKAQTPFRA